MSLYIKHIFQQTSDISAYTYERTLLMEQRTEILSQLKQANTVSFSIVLGINY